MFDGAWSICSSYLSDLNISPDGLSIFNWYSIDIQFGLMTVACSDLGVSPTAEEFSPNMNNIHTSCNVLPLPWLLNVWSLKVTCHDIISLRIHDCGTRINFKIMPNAFKVTSKFDPGILSIYRSLFLFQSRECNSDSISHTPPQWRKHHLGLQQHRVASRQNIMRLMSPSVPSWLRTQFSGTSIGFFLVDRKCADRRCITTSMQMACNRQYQTENGKMARVG